ncbi:MULTISPECIES: methanol oxidation system protein MoxJ [unclassified Xanthobacter]|uniref:methanol oxidation system protein MoxJ n=1 Tax=unclassified Xanthobacter TaxID=2623496 RepID=UPI001EDDC6D9|nr:MULTISPECIES: methanol oxidation system protein MoxJ [unclassified Xanthobacter]
MPRIASSAGATLAAFVFGATLVSSGALAAQFAPAQNGAAAQNKDTPTKDAPAVAAAPGTLRVCASEVEAPFSQKEGKGFENRIAQVLARAMGREAVFVWSGKPAIYQVRDGLDKKLCDVVIGVDTGDARVLTSKPYYRTSYVFVTKADRNITTGDWQDPQIKDLGRFVVRFYSPGETMLKRLGKYEDNAAYLYGLVNFKSPRNQYVEVPAERMVSEVAKGEADVAFAFAPEVARYVKASDVPLRMTVATTDLARFDGTPIPLHYDQSVAVRKDDAALLREVDAALVKARPEIEAILTEEGIPLLKPNS